MKKPRNNARTISPAGRFGNVIRCATQLPNVSEVLRPLLQRVPLTPAVAHRYTERLAAQRYRGWSDRAADETRKAQLEACAARED
ncbi:MAG: hypothetical protein ACRD82_18890 [Blastocatellia bacterium]